MKLKIALLLLAVVVVALAVTLFVTRQKAETQHEQDVISIAYNSNKWQDAQRKWDDEKQNNAQLNDYLDTQKKAYAELTNTYTQVAANLAKTEATVQTLQTTVAQAKEDLAKRDAKIAELEAQNNALDQRANDLTSAITNLTTQIDDTKRKLSASEGDKAFLQTRLKELLAEKAELERQFNDLTVLRSQVAKLREELNIARRLDWIRKGFFSASEQKGAALLLQGANAPGKQPKPPLHYDLNVEVNSDGSVRVIPPLTNAPAGTPPK
jgi:chromosome segregation ATPase